MERAVGPVLRVVDRVEILDVVISAGSVAVAGHLHHTPLCNLLLITLERLTDTQSLTDISYKVIRHFPCNLILE